MGRTPTSLSRNACQRGKLAALTTMAMERPTNFQLVINLKVAREQGITIPASVLTRASRVIN